MRMSHTSRTGLMAMLLASAVSVADLSAQEAVIFVHGLGQSGANWNDLAADLSLEHSLYRYQPNLSWQNYESSQASYLASYLWSLPDGRAAISHSNGGVVVREYVRSTSSPKINRHLTLGTPHLGSTLAANARNGNLLFSAPALSSDIIAPFSWYAAHDPDWYDVVVMGESAWHLEGWAQDLSGLVAYLPYAAAFIGYTVWSPWDVLTDLSPGSSMLQTLNSASALSGEAQKMPTARVSLSTEYPVNLALWRAIVSTDQGAVSAESSKLTLQFFAWELYYYYVWHTDPSLRAHAYMWEDLAYALAETTIFWQSMTGAIGSQSDGIVPWWSSDYPGATNVYHLLQSTLAVNHKAQLSTRNQSTDPYRQLISAIVAGDLGIY